MRAASTKASGEKYTYIFIIHVIYIFVKLLNVFILLNKTKQTGKR